MRAAFTLLLMLAMAPAQAFDHATWNELLEKHVSWVRGGDAAAVDYEGFAQDRDELKRYLAQLSDLEQDRYDEMNRDQKLAFLINAYNAFTVELILRHYPEIDSIKEIGNLFRQPWDIEFFELLGEERKLNELEHKMIRVWFDEPLIHFVVNCASVGCPALRPEALTGEHLDRQMHDSARRFLGDASRNRFDAEEDELQVSPIFDWYGKDFKASGGVKGFLANYAEQLSDNKETRLRIRNGNYDLEYTSYDWDLNIRENITGKDE